MDPRTVRHYDDKAKELAVRYESADMSETQGLLLKYLPAGGSVLEIGCGSGRDSAFLLAKGFDMTAIDASAEMLGEAKIHHPQLAGCLYHESFPLPPDSPILNRQFDGVVSIAALMHIGDQDLFECASQIRDMLHSGGILVLSASIGREEIVAGRDKNGRLFMERPAEQIQLLFERLGFRLVAQYRNKDSFDRKVEWFTLVMQRIEGRTPRAVDEIETIINRDKKVATYKLALLRALCEISQTQGHMAKWHSDGTVSVPLGLVAEKWLLYYWPIVEEDIVQRKWAAMPQTQGWEKSKPIAFRKAMHALIRHYSAHGGLSALYNDYKARMVPNAAKPQLDLTLNKIAQTIVSGPVTYAGGALKGDVKYFRFTGRRSALHRCTDPVSTCGRLGQIVMSGSTWREMCLIGHWVAESLVLRWAELTHELSNRSVPVKDVVDRLLVVPEAERDVHLAKEVYGAVDGLRCVWTDKALSVSFAVDHTVPFSICRSNDLWNLLPADPKVNGRKSDKLVTKGLLYKRRDAILHCWDTMRGATENRFAVELERSLLHEPYNSGNWQHAAFAGLVESVETLAAQRGLERWEP